MAEHFGHERLKVYQKGLPFVSMRKTLLDDLPRQVAAFSDNSQRRSGMTSSFHSSSHTSPHTLSALLVRRLELGPASTSMKNPPTTPEAPGIRVPSRRRPAAGWETETGIIGIEIEIGTGIDSDTNGWPSLHDQILTIIFSHDLAPSTATPPVANRLRAIWFDP